LCYKSVMKKILLGCFVFLIACQGATPAPVQESTPTASLPPQPEPATATVTFTAAPTFSPTPIPLYFTEDFNSSDTGPWDSLQTGGEAASVLGIENGLLRFDLPSANSWYYAIHNVHDYEDVNITAKFSGPPSGSTGLICRHSENGWFEFNIASDGTYNVLFGQSLGDGIANYLPIASDPSEYLSPGTMDYEMGLTCQQNLLSLFINGKLIRNLDVSRFVLTVGKVGISTASFEEAHSIITFEWFRVNQPE
jgi:hypothetical protein